MKLQTLDLEKEKTELETELEKEKKANLASRKSTATQKQRRAAGLPVFGELKTITKKQRPQQPVAVGLRTRRIF